MSDLHYEMQWDCPQCDAAGLLGKTHRHCPQCGAAQDPSRRYFPPPGQEVLAGAHRYVGADWLCTYCESPNSAAASFCANCGGPREQAKTVALVQDTPDASPLASPPKAPAPPPQHAPRKAWPWAKLVLVVVLLPLLWLASQFFQKHDELAQVSAKTWSRSVQVERFAQVDESQWCDAMPADAYQVRRSREQRSTRSVPDGQDCVDVRTDVGDGTFVKRQECSPRYRQEPVYDQRCHYRVNRWQTARTERLQGGADLTPSWPAPRLAPAAPGAGLPGGGALGAERLGVRSESYELVLRSTQGKTWVCPVPAQAWPHFALRASLTVKVRGTGGVDCDSLIH